MLLLACLHIFKGKNHWEPLLSYDCIAVHHVYKTFFSTNSRTCRTSLSQNLFPDNDHQTTGWVSQCLTLTVRCTTEAMFCVVFVCQLGYISCLSIDSLTFPCECSGSRTCGWQANSQVSTVRDLSVLVKKGKVDASSLDLYWSVVFFWEEGNGKEWGMHAYVTVA